MVASLDLDFVAGVYSVGTAAGGTPVSATLTDLVTNPGTITGAGMAITSSDNVTVSLTPALLSGGTWFSSTAGTIVVDCDCPVNTNSFNRLFEMSDGSNNNRIYGAYYNTDFIVGTFSLSGTDTELFCSPYATRARLAIAWSASDYAASLNGATVVTGSGAVPPLTVLQLGNRSVVQNRSLDGDLKRFRYFPTRLSNATIEGLSSATTNYSLTATGGATGAPVLASAVLTVNRVLTATGGATGAPVLASGDLSQAHGLTAAGLVTAAPVLATPSASQQYVFTATGGATGAPVLANPALNQAQVLAAAALATGAPVLAHPAIGQVFALTAAGLVTAAPVLAHAILNPAFATATPRGAAVAALPRGTALPRPL